MEADNANLDRTHKAKLESITVTHQARMKELAREWDSKDRNLDEKIKNMQMQSQELQKEIARLQSSSI